MSISLRLETLDGSETLDLAGIETYGHGVQALSGSTGFGLPPVAATYLEGAGDGAKWRFSRRLARDMDIRLHIKGTTREEFRLHCDELATMLGDSCRLFVVDGRESEWHTDIQQVGGGDFSWGDDTEGETALTTVVTVRSGDPYFSSSTLYKKRVSSAGNKGLLVGSLQQLQVTDGQGIGVIYINNPGDAPSYPVWVVHGPGDHFQATSPSGETLYWDGTLTSSETLTIDTSKGTAIDGHGFNRYGDFGTRPRFWALPAGNTQPTVIVNGVGPSTYVECQFYARRRWIT